LENLLLLEQDVVGLDNFATGNQRNLDAVQSLVGAEQWKRFEFIEDDIRDLTACQQACDGVDYVLHEAALGSVPLSMANPIRCHESNVTGFLNLLVAARDNQVARFVYASSCAIYGNDPAPAKVETNIGRPLSPYAASKEINEVYAAAFAEAYHLETIGLRYFNVFGPRQDPKGPYAAAIPKWAASILDREPVEVYGDGETSRDFCYVENVVQANLLAATVKTAEAVNQVYNVAVGERTTLNQLYAQIERGLRDLDPKLPIQECVHRDFRAGDVRHSMADISKARRLLHYDLQYSTSRGLKSTLAWFMSSKLNSESSVCAK
jgi:UDP-N-acetylglucosamine/UDP-N-acetylgalactosamine 4-epimerase